MSWKTVKGNTVGACLLRVSRRGRRHDNRRDAGAT